MKSEVYNFGNRTPAEDLGEWVLTLEETENDWTGKPMEIPFSIWSQMIAAAKVVMMQRDARLFPNRDVAGWEEAVRRWQLESASFGGRHNADHQRAKA